MITYYQAVLSLIGSENVKGGQTHGPIANITLLNDVEPPSEEAIQAKIKELQADYDAKQYQRDRAVAYPSIEDQLDKIYHSGINEWKKDIKAVKDKFPKPE